MLMFPGNSYGHYHVTSNGTLKIQGVQREDSGFLVCSALSVAGSTTTRAFLQVTSVDDVPPPIIQIGPANQTLPLKSVATLPCQATGVPIPTIKWYKNGSPLTDLGSRITVVDSGNLHIDDLQLTDTGLYTCTASSESGETSWSASLTVERNPSLSGPNLHRTPDPSMYPSPPSVPKIINITESSITLSWSQGPSTKEGAAPPIGYTVEYFSSDLQTGWVVAANRVPAETITIGDLKPHTSYVFLVRAENSYGLSIPSPLSERVHTLGAEHQAVSQYELDEARARLSSKVVQLRDIQLLTSTSVRLIWDIINGEEYVEGLYVRFRDLSGGSQKYNMVTVLNAGSTSYVLSNLRKFTKYEFFLVPFYKSVEGQPSNSKTGQTLEDVPSAPPDNVQVGIINATAAFVRWSPPPPQHHNGVLLGYKIQVKGNGSRILAQLTLNATTTSVLLNNLTTGNSYSTRVVAFTRVGSGAFSAPVTIVMDPSMLHHYPHRAHPSKGEDNSVVSETWFLVLMSSMVLALLLGFIALLYLRRKQAGKKELGHLNVPVVNANDISQLNLMNGKETLWIDRGWQTSGSADKDSGLLETKLLNTHSMSHELSSAATDYAEVDPQNLTTFYNCQKQSEIPVPYATTTLINSVPRRDNVENGHLFVPITIGGHAEPKMSASSDSCTKASFSSLNKNSDMRRKSSSPNSDAGNTLIGASSIQLPRLPHHVAKHVPNASSEQSLPTWSEILHPASLSLESRASTNELGAQLANSNPSSRGIPSNFPFHQHGVNRNSPLPNNQNNCSREGTPPRHSGVNGLVGNAPPFPVPKGDSSSGNSNNGYSNTWMPSGSALQNSGVQSKNTSRSKNSGTRSALPPPQEHPPPVPNFPPGFGGSSTGGSSSHKNQMNPYPSRKQCESKRNSYPETSYKDPTYEVYDGDSVSRREFHQHHIGGNRYDSVTDCERWCSPGGEGSWDEEHGSCSSGDVSDTCCSCSESSCLYAEAQHTANIASQSTRTCFHAPACDTHHRLQIHRRSLNNNNRCPVSPSYSPDSNFSYARPPPHLISNQVRTHNGISANSSLSDGSPFTSLNATPQHSRREDIPAYARPNYPTSQSSQNNTLKSSTGTQRLNDLANMFSNGPYLNAGNSTSSSSSVENQTLQTTEPV